MVKVRKTYDDEIDLLDLILTVWEGKWKIAFVIVVFLISVYVFNIVKPSKIFTASTDIKPITSFEFDKYGLFNSSLKVIENFEKEEKIFKIFEITQQSLLDLYIEAIQEGSLLETGIDKFNFFNRDDYDSDSEYKEVVEKFASQIEILKPIQDGNKLFSHHVIKVAYDDENKWKKLLAFVNSEANRKVKATIINRFTTIVSIQNQKKDFAVKDLQIKINNVLADYDLSSQSRLAFLSEQAAIARKLDIKKNTIASQKFSTQNTFVTNVKTDTPFYLRGYLAIEEEIKQIKNRKNKSMFISEFFKLEKLKREIEQDKTITRAIDLFNKTPLNQENFKATIVKVATTSFKIENKSNLYYVLAIVIGGIIGVVYVLIEKAFINRKIV